MRTKVMLCAACALAGGAPAAEAAFPGRNGRIVIAGDRPSHVDARAGDMDIWTFDPDGGHARNLTPMLVGDEWSPRWSADGRRIVFTSNSHSGGQYDLFVMNADGTGRRQLTSTEQTEDVASWSPDGRRIVFDRWFGDFDADVLTIRADGGGEQNLTRSPGVMERQPSWSPDGREIAFSFGGDAGTQRGDIYTMRPDGSRRRQLTATASDTDPRGTDEETPVWAPDGRSLAFNGDTAAGDFELWVMRADGSGRRNVTNSPDSGDGGGAWSPDGRTLLFGSDRDDDGNPEDADHDLYAMRADGGRQRNITRDPYFETGPDWQPLPRHAWGRPSD
jgi:Tol biopolymer transport system component